tara:strand:+ start:59 stop:214 length:156 start_codon:yes stop_codon:yes gene_type:complete
MNFFKKKLNITKTKAAPRKGMIKKREDSTSEINKCTNNVHINPKNSVETLP